MNPSRKIFLKGLILAMLVALLDQYSKYWVSGLLSARPSERIMSAQITILPIFNLVLVHNTGISFGMGRGLAWAQQLFSIVAILIAAGLLFWLYKTKEIWQGIAISLALGGAAGNIFDRISSGSVVDFLDFHIGARHWPAFNVADSAVCIGACILIFNGLFENKERKAS